LFPIDGILSTPPNTLVIYYWTGDVGGERRRKGGTVTKEKKEGKFHDLLLQLNPKSPNKKFRFSLKLQVPYYFMGIQKQEEKRKIQNPISHKTTQFLPHPKFLKKIAVRDSSWPHHTFERNNQFFSNEFNEQRSP
jgi:hypothetical protein